MMQPSLLLQLGEALLECLHRVVIERRAKIAFSSKLTMNHLKSMIREVPDFPKPGILFYDITTLLKDAGGLKAVIDGLADGNRNQKIDTVVGIEARGFIFAPAVAHAIGAGFVPVRKPNKLPAKAERVEYALEYGTDILEIHEDAVHVGHRVLIVDDVLATGGTAAAVAQLVQKLGGEVVGLHFVIELDFSNPILLTSGRIVFPLSLGFARRGIHAMAIKRSWQG